MKVLILGSTGIIGSHLRITPHPGITASYHKGRKACDLTDPRVVVRLLNEIEPDAIVNLAGESRPDVVEAEPAAFESINTLLPLTLVRWACLKKKHLVHVSSQAVFDGDGPPYAGSKLLNSPINQYGSQKNKADQSVIYDVGGYFYKEYCHTQFTIIRPTFVLGIRPDPTVGRPNPVELMLEGQRKQVNDRWFSPSFAPDVASLIWDVCRRKPSGEVIHAGVPVRVSRYDIARALGCDVEPVSHEDFPGIAPRPRDTTYAEGASYGMNFEEGIADCLRRWKMRQAVAA